MAVIFETAKLVNGMERIFNVEKLIRQNVKELHPYASARDEFVSDGSRMIFLDANENPFENGVNRYPDPQQRSLKAVLAAQRGLDVKNLLLGNGSDEILDLLYRTFCEPGIDNVITLPPTYGMYKVLAGVNAVENREVGLTAGFEPDMDQIRESIDRQSKMIFLCSPNNPTGNTFSRESIISLLMNFGGLVVIDEAYVDFSSDPGWIGNLKEYPNLVVIQTLSKAYGMAGIRLGICCASPEIIEAMNKIKPPYNVNELTQERAYARLLEQETVREEIALILQEREKLRNELALLEYVQQVYPSQANFLLIRVDDATKRYRQLIQKGIVVRNRSSQPRCENTLRLTVGTSAENRALLNALKSI